MFPRSRKNKLCKNCVSVECSLKGKETVKCPTHPRTINVCVCQCSSQKYTSFACSAFQKGSANALEINPFVMSLRSQKSQMRNESLTCSWTPQIWDEFIPSRRCMLKHSLLDMWCDKGHSCHCATLTQVAENTSGQLLAPSTEHADLWRSLKELFFFLICMSSLQLITCGCSVEVQDEE